MKKSVVLTLVSLGLIVLISPGLIGQFAERSVDQNIRKGTVENDAVVVDALAFDRGWFLSEGRHRIEIKDSPLADRIRGLANLPPDYQLPVITVTTRIDHGVFPVASMNREHGTLLPGLGDAVSTISLEMPDGHRVELPGAVHTRIGLTGTTRSTYALPAGEFTEDGGGLRWSDGEIRLDVHPASNRVDFGAALATLELLGGDGPFDLSGLDVEGTFEPGAYGFALGDLAASVVAFTAGDQVHGPLVASGRSRIIDEQLGLEFALDVDLDAPGAGAAKARVDLDLNHLDPRAFGRLLRRYRVISGDAGDTLSALERLEPEAQALLARGLTLDVRRLELALPDGILDATLAAEIDENGADSGNWAALLLATTANADIRAAEGLMATIIALNPEAGALVGMGYLKPDGDDFVTEIRYAKGILTINGAPMTIPLP